MVQQIKNSWILVSRRMCVPSLALLAPVCVPEAQKGQTYQNVEVWSRERFIAGLSKENRWLIF